MSNPYSTKHPWSPETLKAWQDMPKDIHGRNLGFTEGNREAWREWFKRTPKELHHPVAVATYQNLDRMKEMTGGKR